VVYSLLRIENFSSNCQGHGEDYTYCDQIYNRISVNNAVNTNPKRKYPIFAGCIAPPTASCVRCNGELTKHNSPTLVSFYRINSPLPFLKVELCCCTCGINYGISKFANAKEGYKYYICLGIVEASDMAYMDRLFMTMFKSLKYVTVKLIRVAIDYMHSTYKSCCF